MKFSEFTPLDDRAFSPEQLAVVHASFGPGKTPPQWIEMGSLSYMILRDAPAVKSIQDRDLADACAAQVYQLMHAMGGGNIYFPRGDRVSLADKYKLICSEFNGRNINEMARKHGLSSARIMQIVDKDYALKRAAGRRKTSDGSTLAHQFRQASDSSS